MTSERHISLLESLLRQGYKYGFLCKQLCNTFDEQGKLFANIQSHLREIKNDIPFAAMVIKYLLQYDLSSENLILNIHPVFECGRDWKVGYQ